MSSVAKTALTDVQLAELRKLLESKRRELVASTARARSAMEVDEPLVERMDAAERAKEEADLVEVDAVERALLEEVVHALAKIDDGSYGVSEESGEPIPFARLRAVPWARYLVDEEERIESAR